MFQYQNLVRHILQTGTRKENRTGVDTISTFGAYYEHDMMQGFPLLTTKSVSWKNIVIEMLWFLSGQTDIAILKRHGCKFWDAWSDENGKVPSAYGSFWVNWQTPRIPAKVEARQPTGMDYVAPKFEELPVEKNHEICGQLLESVNDGPFRVVRKDGTDESGRSTFTLQFTNTGFVSKSIRMDVVRLRTVRDPFKPRIHGVGYAGDYEVKTDLDQDLRKVWGHMLDRCYAPHCKEFEWYGAKGVTVCTRWFNFSEFRRDCMSLPNWINKRDSPKMYSLDKDYYRSSCYSPNTCVWLSKADNVLYASSRAFFMTDPSGHRSLELSRSEAAEREGLTSGGIGEALRGNGRYKDFQFGYAPEGDEYRYPLPINQIAWVLAELQKNPMSRRMVVSAWAPGNAQTSKLPPCHCMFVLNVQNTTSSPRGGQRLCLHLTQRSCDVALGVPYNLASYALLLHLFARFAGPESGITPGIFGHSLVDAHIYTKKPDGAKAEFDHVPGLMEQCGRRPRALPTLHIDPQIRTLADVEALMAPGIPTEDVMKLFVLENYNPYPAIPFKVAV